jgi:SAM-dependent methyltransferase
VVVDAHAPHGVDVRDVPPGLQRDVAVDSLHDVAEGPVPTDRDPDLHGGDRLTRLQVCPPLGLQEMPPVPWAGAVISTGWSAGSSGSPSAAGSTDMPASLPDVVAAPELVGRGADSTWPARYRLHKYWSRKPGDVVRALIDEHSDPGDLVLDPCCGSGVAPFEAAAAGRRAVGVDVNPFAVALSRATLERCDPDRIDALGRVVLAAVREREGRWHRTRCRRCGAEAALAGTAWRRGAACAVLVRCDDCGGTRREEPDDVDRRRARAASRHGVGDAPRPPVEPGWQTRKLVRAGLRDFGELFTVRNLRALAAVREEILALPEGPERRLLGLALTGSLAQASRMMADHSAAGGGASWKLNIYWLPSAASSSTRCTASRTGCGGWWPPSGRRRRCWRPPETVPAGRIVRADARALGGIVEPGSVRYAFVDPPYGGEGIQYGELSALWCGWLDPPERPDVRGEIGCNPVQGRSADDFAAGLVDLFRGVRRAMADDGRLTVTFASRHAASWAALRAALDAAALEVVSADARPRSAPGLTERTSPGSTRADAWLDVRPARAG